MYAQDRAGWREKVADRVKRLMRLVARIELTYFSMYGWEQL